MTRMARLRAAGPRAILRALRPVRVDELLYGVGAHDTLPPSACSAHVDIARFDRQSLSGDAAVDRRLDGRRVCYVARVDGRVAHRSWLHLDTVLPSLFGFAAAPVVGDCATDPAFRGLHLYPHVLAHIVADVRARGMATEVHVLVSPDNVASIRGIERAGFRLLDRLRGVRVGPFVLRQPAPAGRAPSA